VPGIPFGAQNIFEKVSVAGVFTCRRRLRNRAIEIGYSKEPEVDRKLGDTVVLEIGHATTSSF
jgi:hypothetical protein